MSIGNFEQSLKSLEKIAISKNKSNAIFGRLMLEILPVLQTAIETELKNGTNRKDITHVMPSIVSELLFFRLPICESRDRRIKVVEWILKKLGPEMQDVANTYIECIPDKKEQH